MNIRKTKGSVENAWGGIKWYAMIEPDEYVETKPAAYEFLLGANKVAVRS